jgi:hypothetical protein
VAQGPVVEAARTSVQNTAMLMVVRF